MGAGIAQVALEAGWAVRLHDAAPGAIERGRARIADGLRRRAAKRAARRSVPTRPGSTSGWPVSRSRRARARPRVGAELVIEAIVEDLEAKRRLFAELDAAAAGGDDPRHEHQRPVGHGDRRGGRDAAPERVLGLHFFNPAPVLLLVEVVAGERTDPERHRSGDRASSSAWGKTAVRSADSPGFIVNRVNRPFTIEALRMLEAGEARVGEIDAAVRADGFPMGPFELMDLVGLDVNLAAATAVWDGLGRPERLRPSPIQAWLVAHRSRLGRKAGVGFYRYHDGHDPVLEPLPHDVARPVRDAARSPRPTIVRRIRTAIAAEAVLARDDGVASEADIDTALWLGAAHPEGPFAWLRRQGAEVRARTIGA